MMNKINNDLGKLKLLGVILLILAILLPLGIVLPQAPVQAQTQIYDYGVESYKNTNGSLINRETGKPYAPGDEIIEERTENGKRYYVDEGSYKLVISMGAVHYKEQHP